MNLSFKESRNQIINLRAMVCLSGEISFQNFSKSLKIGFVSADKPGSCNETFLIDTLRFVKLCSDQQSELQK